LKLSESSRKLFKMDHPVHAPFHFVVFCIFYSAAILCSAIIHDSERNLPQRERALAVLGGALDILKQLSPSVKMGAMSYALLLKLVTILPSIDKERVTAENSRSPKRVKTNLPTPKSLQHSPKLLLTELTQASAAQYVNGPETVALMSTADDFQWMVDPTLPQFDFDGFSSNDFGGLEQVWHWDSLNLDPGSFDPQNLGLDPVISIGTTLS